MKACRPPITPSPTTRSKTKRRCIKSITPPTLKKPREVLVNKSTVLLPRTYLTLTRIFYRLLQEKEESARKQDRYYKATIGEILLGRFKILESLGQGTFGNVWKAEDLISKQLLAIKILRRNDTFLKQGERERSFLTELGAYERKLMDKGQRSFIVRSYGSFMLDNHLFILLELLSKNLFQLFSKTFAINPKNPGLSLRIVHKITHQLLSALVRLQDLQIIHCDLKPENISLVHPNKAAIKLLDFGISAKLTDDVSRCTPYTQSRPYRAPEVLCGVGPYGYPIDMWSLGCIIVELYLARPLFFGKDTTEQLYKIMEVLGKPPELFQQGRFFTNFFLIQQNGDIAPIRKYNFKPTNLREILQSKTTENQSRHFSNLYNLVSKMLVFTPSERITPKEALNHPFVADGPAGRYSDNQEFLVIDGIARLDLED